MILAIKRLAGSKAESASGNKEIKKMRKGETSWIYSNSNKPFSRVGENLPKEARAKRAWREDLSSQRALILSKRLVSDLDCIG